MCTTKIWNLIYSWIIYILMWIICSESVRLESLRRNQGEKECLSELVSNNLLTDEQFTASSHLQNKNTFQPSMARLLDIHSQVGPNDGRAWCPATTVHKDQTEWIEIDFRRMMILNTLYTMGRGDGNFKKFSPQIVIKYQRSVSGQWYTYRDSQNETVIQINTDARSKLRTRLQTIVARKIRIFPLDSVSGPRAVCLKLAFLGCYFGDEVVSYTAPQGDKSTINGQMVNLRDDIYDGQRTGSLQHGLGILMNNKVYMNSPTAKDIINGDLSTFFTGWKCTNERRENPISITFYFDHERVFSQISIYYVKSLTYGEFRFSPIVVSIGYNNDTHRSVYNYTVHEKDESLLSAGIVNIPLHQKKGIICTLNISCGSENWIILSEIEIHSKKFLDFIDASDTKTVANIDHHSSTNASITGTGSDYTLRDSSWMKKDLSFVVVIGFIIVIATILLICVMFLFYKLRRLRKPDLNKKLEIIAKYNERRPTDPHLQTIFARQTKHPSVSSMAKLKYCTDNRTTMINSYSGSQVSDGAYASWPNTDEDAEVPKVDKEDGKYLLGADATDNQSSIKDYATYQPIVEHIGNEYFQTRRPSSVVMSLQSLISLSDKVVPPVSSPRTLPIFDMSKSNQLINYRNCKNVITYQHLINYRGICEDVDIRYQSNQIRSDPNMLDSNIRIVPTSSLVFIKHWVRGKFGSLNLVTTTQEDKKKCQYFMKTINPDATPDIKSKFIIDLKILSSLTISSIARLAAIVIDCDQFPGNKADAIKSGRFSLLIENNEGYNLKEFLRNMYYPSKTQSYKSTPVVTPCQLSTSFALLLTIQISSALRHLEELGLTHRDVGCRNCTIDMKRQIKLYPGGYVTAHPLEDYCSIELQNNLIHFPLRWLAPESIAKGIYTSKSDVWSFGVTMWEVFTLCSLVPYPSLSNEALMELMIDRENVPRIICPLNCPKEMYDLMIRCWSWDECQRPTFKDLNLFLQVKVNGSTNLAQYMLPSPPPSITDIYHSI